MEPTFSAHHCQIDEKEGRLETVLATNYLPHTKSLPRQCGGFFLIFDLAEVRPTNVDHNLSSLFDLLSLA